MGPQSGPTQSTPAPASTSTGLMPLPGSSAAGGAAAAATATEGADGDDGDDGDGGGAAVDLNKMAADLLRAELMDDEDEVARLEKLLARAKSKASKPKPGGAKPGGGRGAAADGEVNTASAAHIEGLPAEMLITTTRGGMSMPALGSKIERDRQAYSGKVRRVRTCSTTFLVLP